MQLNGEPAVNRALGLC